MDNSQGAKRSKSIHFKGVIGTLRFDNTRGGIPKLTMSIAEHPNAKDPSETVWHKKCVATRELAETLNTLSPPLSVGEEIDVKVGYPYSWQYTDKQGRNRINEGVNLWIVAVRGQTYAAKRSK